MSSLNLPGGTSPTPDHQDYSDDEGRGADQYHLSRDCPENSRAFGINSIHEWYCVVCRTRITVTPDLVEVGHHRDCPQRPDHLDRGEDPHARRARACPVCGVEGGDHQDDCRLSGWACPTCMTGGFDSKKARNTHHTKAHGKRLRTKKCPSCQAVFAPDDSDQVFCSQPCADSGKRSREERSCEWCGTPFETISSDPQRFCTTDCAAAASGLSRRASDPHECEYCGDEFYRTPSIDGPYCSEECYHESGRETRTCSRCEDTFNCRQSSSQEYCSRECAIQAVGESRREGDYTECSECGAIFYRCPADDSSFCNRDCYLESLSGGDA